MRSFEGHRLQACLIVYVVMLLVAARVHAQPLVLPSERGSASVEERPWAKGISERDQKASLALYLDGNQDFTESRFAPALVKYRQAVQLWDHPAIHFNMAVSFIHLDRLLEAKSHLEKSLSHGEPALGAVAYSQGLTYRKLLDAQLVKLTIKSTEIGATLTLDGKHLFVAPDEMQLVVLPGAHQLVATKDGYLTASETFVLTPGTPRAYTLNPILAPALAAKQREPAPPCSTGPTYSDPTASQYVPPLPHSKSRAPAALKMVTPPPPPTNPEVWRSSIPPEVSRSGLQALQSGVILTPPSTAPTWIPEGFLAPTPPPAAGSGFSAPTSSASGSSTTSGELSSYHGLRHVVPPVVESQQLLPSGPSPGVTSQVPSTPVPSSPLPSGFERPMYQLSGYKQSSTYEPTSMFEPPKMYAPTTSQSLIYQQSQLRQPPHAHHPQLPTVGHSPVPHHPSPTAPSMSNQAQLDYSSQVHQQLRMHQPVLPTPTYQPPTPIPPTPTYQPPTPTYQPPVYRPPTPTYQPPTPTYQPPVYRPPTPTYQPPVYRPPTPTYQPPTYQPPTYQPPTPTYQPPVYRPPTPTYQPPVYRPPTPTYQPPTPTYQPPKPFGH